ncbi:hypothetical protein KOR42_47720 [Thalassoglobus neptunius]|uniref:Uncharacterized protein n=1 Tax=Thalassoglobus neptunius TaxID=1938619 RepID=A0A5C5VV62_9PLAN|nr:hypothetical protein KOR42_47720 [Thalassoglobus neptunius]
MVYVPVLELVVPDFIILPTERIDWVEYLPTCLVGYVLFVLFDVWAASGMSQQSRQAINIDAFAAVLLFPVFLLLVALVSGFKPDLLTSHSNAWLLVWVGWTLGVSLLWYVARSSRFFPSHSEFRKMERRLGAGNQNNPVGPPVP